MACQRRSTSILHLARHGHLGRNWFWRRWRMLAVIVVMVMVVIMIAGRRQGAPVDGGVGGGIAVGGLGQLVKVLIVLLAKCVVLSLQPAAIGRLADLRLLPLVIGALLLVVGPLLGLGVHLLLVGVDSLLVEPLQMVRIRIALREGILAKVEILVDDFAVAGLMDQFAAATRAGPIGIFE